MVRGEELHRRVRSAMELAGITSWQGLADATKNGEQGYGRSTLKALGTTEDEPNLQHLRAVADACEVPLAWFALPDLRAVVADADPEQATLAERVEALEGKVEALTRRESDESRTPPGVLGRNAQGSPPSDGRPKPADSPDEEEDSQPGTGEA